MDIEKLRDLAEAGRVACQIELGHSYLKGVDFEGNAFPQDFSHALYWLRKAHSQGSSTGTLLLGTIFEHGLGLDKDVDKAISLYESAAAVGSVYASVNLARIYSDERSNYFDRKNARKYYDSVIAQEDDLDDTASTILMEAKAFVNHFVETADFDNGDPVRSSREHRSKNDN